ncbi:MAG TPA: hypothetical protein VMM56_05590 [Planctomycetaceae bacterium]|nr:hypothetical protein [Planctomycetaceae bacterium]
MIDESVQSAPPCPRAIFAAQVVALLIGLLLIGLEEWPRVSSALETGQWGGLLIDFNYNSTLPAILMLLLPVAYFIRSGVAQTDSNNTRGRRTPVGVALLMMSLAIGTLSLLMSWSVAQNRVGPDDRYVFGHLPPAYHDEFSYLFQARTFLDGRVSYPSHAEYPELFTQVHVVNEGRFASRYFPATGVVIAPFEAMRFPNWGHWLCGALTAAMMFWIGVELGGLRVGLLSGLFTALSPGLALFSNLLLAHHPTLLGLSVFLYGFLRMTRTRSAGAGFLAGCGLTFAMLARPMSAAGFALPMGLVLLAGLIRPAAWVGTRKTAFKLNLAVGLPVLAGLASLLPYNFAMTGDAFTTPYSLYMNTYTPRHVYGFENVVRGSHAESKETFRKYDLWAENLTPAKAIENLQKRLHAASVWTWGLIPLFMAGTAFLVLIVERPLNRWTLIGCSIVSIYVVHVPYWFSGIMDWHYVLESSVPALLMLAYVTSVMWDSWGHSGRQGLRLWWIGLLAAPLLTMYIPAGEMWETSRMRLAVGEVAFSRIRYQRFDELLAENIENRSAIVLIKHDPADVHIDYVTNVPSLDAAILRGRSDEGKPSAKKVRELQNAFPDREIWYFDVARRSLVQLSVPVAKTE